MGFWDLFTETLASVNGHNPDEDPASNAAAEAPNNQSSSSSSDSGMCMGSSGSNGSGPVLNGLSESDFARIQDIFTQG